MRVSYDPAARTAVPTKTVIQRPVWVVQARVLDCAWAPWVLLVDGPVETAAQARDVVTATRFPPLGQRSQLATLPCRHRIYTHINNTNPMLVERSPESALVERAGLTIGVDGLSIGV